MKSVIENVLSQRCDSLAGWWALLIEKEERKAKRRERKRREREAEAKSLRRLSAASSRLDRIAPTIRELDEEHLSVPMMGDPRRVVVHEYPGGHMFYTRGASQAAFLADVHAMFAAH